MRGKHALAMIITFAAFNGAAYYASNILERGDERKGGYKGSETAMKTIGNHLAGEKSPYLLQHADNPVDWYPWGETAFEKARAEDKPIFLSIGYSTCHWCHVMAHDSFESEEVAALLNRSFVSIKVDREERPDVDSVYMLVCQAMTGSGGWPLTIIMTPDKKPFFAGTFIPADDSRGRMGLKSLLPEIARRWRDDRGKVAKAAEGATRIFQTRTDAGGGAPGGEVLDAAFETLSENFDSSHGGFGGAPKFPTSHNISFLLRYWKRTGDKKALEMVEKTLDNIDRGGIHDHVGGGFHRYSVDAEWIVPHFEKMLYDQALLAGAFIEAYQATGKERYADAARDIFDYVLRDMTRPGGGFYSGEDADSEGGEGKFYVWKQDELNTVLGGERAKIFNEYYGVTAEGNFEEGTNVLNIPKPREKMLKELGVSESEAKKILDESLANLFNERKKRPRPHLDDKIITSWNALMISALARGAAALGERQYCEAAEKAADFILSDLRGEGGLLRRYRDGEAAIPAFLDDYAFLTLALMDLYEADLDPRRLEEAKALGDEMLRLFWNEKDGGLNFSSERNEKMIGEIKHAYDGAEPSGNSIAALALLRLVEYTMDDSYRKKAEGIFSAFSGDIARYPAGFTQMLIALDFSLAPSTEIVLTGKKNDAALRDMLDAVYAEFLPNRVLIYYPSDGGRRKLETIVPFLKMKDAIGGKPTAYVCRDFTCKFPTTDVNALRKSLKK